MTRRATSGLMRRSKSTLLINQLVGTQEGRRWQLDANGLGCPEIDHYFELCRLLNRNVSGLSAFEDFSYKGSNPAVHGDKIHAIGHKPSGLNVALEDEHCGQALLDGKRSNTRLARSEVRAR